MTAEERFWANVIKGGDDDCWIWGASHYKNGYAKFWANGKSIKAHRFAYELLVGIIPVHLEIDHLCRNRGCVNPKHMETVTRSENTRRGLLPNIGRVFQRSKTHCPAGHAYDLINTYFRHDGGRDCKACSSRRGKIWRQAHA